MKLICYRNPGSDIEIRPSDVKREWMDASSDRFAYRCLPLAIANSAGWELLNPCTFHAIWNGSKIRDAISVTPEADGNNIAISHFGEGVLTFHVSCLFKTEPGYDLLVMGAPNRPKDGIQALTGIIETDWSPYSFTMNWIFTSADTMVTFEKGEPFCFFFPIKRGLLEQIEPEYRPWSDDAELHKEHEEWSASRNQFITDLEVEGSDAYTQRWQKSYYHGKRPSGAPGVEDHRTRVRLKPFHWRRGALKPSGT